MRLPALEIQDQSVTEAFEPHAVGANPEVGTPFWKGSFIEVFGVHVGAVLSSAIQLEAHPCAAPAVRPPRPNQVREVEPRLSSVAVEVKPLGPGRLTPWSLGYGMNSVHRPDRIARSERRPFPIGPLVDPAG